jgi:hypothetical protein
MSAKRALFLSDAVSLGGIPFEERILQRSPAFPIAENTSILTCCAGDAGGRRRVGMRCGPPLARRARELRLVDRRSLPQ